jgi:ribosomal protein S18 acetylase RimI-like enzyme
MSAVMTRTTVRAATEADLPAVLELYAQPALDNGTRLPLPDARRLLARFARYPDYSLYVACAEGLVVGVYALLIMDNLAHLGAPSGVVEDVAVAPAHQGLGVGRAMMAHALERCRDAGCYKLSLSSNLRREDAHRFYESLGFERHGYSYRVFP